MLRQKLAEAAWPKEGVLIRDKMVRLGIRISLWGTPPERVTVGKIGRLHYLRGRFAGAAARNKDGRLL